MQSIYLKYFLSLLLINGVAKNFFSQEVPKSRIDSIFHQFSNETPGISVSLIEKNKNVLRKSYGSAQLEYGIPVNSNTVFHIASDSKRFTALAILILEEQGKLRLSDSIQTYLKGFPSFSHKISIKDLLQHTSGLRDQWQLLGMAGWRMEDIVTQEQIIKVLNKQRELNFIPNSEFVYCNSGYTLLAVIVEVVSGQTFEDFTRKNIFEPLGMLNTHFHTNHRQIVENRAYSYSSLEDKTFQKDILNFANAGATGLFTTLEDMEKWLMNVLSNNPKVGSTTIFKKMQKQLILKDGAEMIYGIGEMVFNIGGKKLIGHGGNDAGFNSFVGYYPDYKLGVVALCNWKNISSGNLVIQVASEYLKGKSSPKNGQNQTSFDEVSARERNFIKPKKEALESQVGIYETVWGHVYVKQKDGELFFKNVGDDEEFLLYKAESKDRYYNEDMKFELSFIEEQKNIFKRLKVVGPNNTNFSAQRIHLADYSIEDLKEFEGNYYSEELQTIYSIVLENDALVAKHFRHSDIPLSVKSKDRFTGNKWFFDSLEFTRDENDRINGVLISGSRGRAKDVRFNKK